MADFPTIPHRSQKVGVMRQLFNVYLLTGCDNWSGCEGKRGGEGRRGEGREEEGEGRETGTGEGKGRERVIPVLIFPHFKPCLEYLNCMPQSVASSLSSVGLCEPGPQSSLQLCTANSHQRIVDNKCQHVPETTYH